MPKIKGPRKSNRYPDEFKIRAVKLADQPELIAKDVAENLGIHPIMLYRWRKEYREGKFKEDKRRKAVSIEATKMAKELKELQQLKREVQRLRIENELLKKTIEFNSERRNTSSNS